MKKEIESNSRGKIIDPTIQEKIRVRKRKKMSNRKIAKELNISPSTVSKYAKKRKITTERNVKKKLGRKKKIGKIKENKILEEV